MIALQIDMDKPPETAAAFLWLLHEAHDVAEQILERVRRLHRRRVLTDQELDQLRQAGLDLPVGEES